MLLMAGIAGGLIWGHLPRKPNLLLITLDTTRADRLGCYGASAARTPALDALAKSGARFRHAYATAPLTLSSHATMLTGLYPPEHGLRTNGKGRLHKDIPTLSHTLKQAGYRTGAFVGAFVLDSKFGLEQGFDEYDDDLSEARRTEDPLHRERPGNAVIDRALEWLQRNSRRPFFCWAHLYDPHFPYQPHPEEFGEDFQQRPYDGELAYVDRQVQRLLEFLRTKQLTDNTLVMVVGDHGEGLGDHQETMHGYMLYNSTMHVPWLAAWPGRIPPESVIEEPVSLVDLMPTVLHTLQVSPPPKMSGRSLKPAFDGSTISPSPCYAETNDPQLDNGWSPLQMLLTADWKYIRTAKPELFQWRADFQEQHNLAALQPDELQRVDEELTAFLAGLSPRGTDTAVLSSREKRVLASLGYTAGQSETQPIDEATGPDIKDMVAHFNRVVEATHLMEAGSLTEAETLLRETVEAVPDYTAAWGNLGRCLAQQSRFHEARDCYQRVLDKNAEDTSALLNLATAYLAEKRPRDATEALRRLLEFDPESADAFFYLAGASMQIGKSDEAHGHLRRAVTCDPQHIPALNGLGDFFFEQGQSEKCLEYYAAAIHLDPHAPGPYINRGIALGQLNRLDEASASFVAGLKYEPEHPLLHSNLGFARQQQRRYDDAIRHYQQALQSAPEEPQALVNLPLLLSASPDSQLRDGARAVDLARKAVDISRGQSPEAYHSLAAAYAETGQFPESLAAIDAALRVPHLSHPLRRTLMEHREFCQSRRPLRLAE